MGLSGPITPLIIGTNAVGTKVQRIRSSFSDRVETKGEVLGHQRGWELAATTAPISLMPFAEISTRFFVTPIATITMVRTMADLLSSGAKR